MGRITIPVMRYYGAKFRLAKWILNFFPPNHTYIEPFGGAAGVLIQKPQSKVEVYNDLDGDIVNVFKVLRDPEKAKRLQSLLRLTPVSRSEFDSAFNKNIDTNIDAVEQARKTLIRAYMGFVPRGSTKNRTGFRFQDGSGISNSWLKYPDFIPLFTKRLRQVIIENRPAIQVIETHDRANSLFFIDPPYVSTTRTSSGKTYQHEMSNYEHEELLLKLISLKGMVVLSGYDDLVQ